MAPSIVLYIFTLLSAFGVYRSNGSGGYQVENWKFHFLPGSGMGLFMAVALPLDLPNKNAYLAYNFEANYMLPGNQTSFEYPPLVQKAIDRKLVYSALETKIQSNGYPGKACLLRTICEAAKHQVNHINGVLGDILHIVFTPSTSKSTKRLAEYETAEKMGRQSNDCVKYNKNCTVSFLDLISWIGSAAY